MIRVFWPFFVVLFLFSPAEADILSDIPSPYLREKLSNRKAFVADLDRSSEARESLLSFVWDEANSRDDVGDRLYLYALAIDLYNSLEAGHDFEKQNPSEVGGKSEWHWNITSVVSYGNKPTDAAWKNALFKNDVLAKQRVYIFHYIRENAVLDEWSSAPSITRVSFKDPTLLRGLRKYMQESQPRIQANLAPWEDASSLPIQSGPATVATPMTYSVSEQMGLPTTADVIQPSNTPSSASESKGKPNKAQEPSVWLWVIVGIATAVAIAALVLRRRK